MTDGRPNLPSKVYRTSPVIGPDGKRLNQPAAHRQAEPKHRQAGEQAAPAPLSITADWPAVLAMVNASIDPAASLAEVIRSTVAGASESLRQHTVTSMMPMVERAVQAARRDGFKAGRREGLAAGSVELKASPELLEALRQPAPTVTVQASPVEVRNEIIVPARKIIATTMRDGSVEMSPVDE